MHEYQMLFGSGILACHDKLPVCRASKTKTRQLIKKNSHDARILFLLFLKTDLCGTHWSRFHNIVQFFQKIEAYWYLDSRLDIDQLSLIRIIVGLICSKSKMSIKNKLQISKRIKTFYKIISINIKIYITMVFFRRV